jgi:hypothetical protein
MFDTTPFHEDQKPRKATIATNPVDRSAKNTRQLFPISGPCGTFYPQRLSGIHRISRA